MNNIKKLNEFSTINLKQQIKKGFIIHNKSDLIDNTQHIISLLAQLKPKYTIAFFKSIDLQSPGLSLHFVMEARHYNCEDQIQKDCLLLLSRLSYFMKAFPDKYLFSPMRKRLFLGLLFDDNNTYSEFFTDVKNGFNYIESITSLTVSEKAKLKKSFNKLFFDKYLLIYRCDISEYDNKLEK